MAHQIRWTNRVTYMMTIDPDEVATYFPDYSGDPEDRDALAEYLDSRNGSQALDEYSIEHYWYDSDYSELDWVNPA